METTYWGDAVTPELLAAIPTGVRVRATPMGIEYVRMFEASGLLPQASRAAAEDACDVLIVLGRKSMLRGEYLRYFQWAPSIADTRRGGVVLAKLVARDAGG